MENRFKFTRNGLDKVPTPTSGRTWVYDTERAGLALQITAAGSRSFYRRGRIHGVYRFVRIGSYPDVTIEQARKAVAAMTGEIALGDDPHAERLQKRGEPTLGDLFARWIDQAKTVKRSWPEDERQYKKFLSPWSGRRLSSLKPDEIQTWHAKLGADHGPYAANRVLALLRAAYNKARQLVGYTGDNPARGVTRFPEASRDRFLQPAELPKFFAAVAAEPDPLLRDFFVVLLLTGARRSNVQAMRWRDIDLARRVWFIAAESAKGKKSLAVPIVDQVAEILDRRNRESSGSEFVFSSYGAKGHLVEPKGAWQKLLARSGIENLRLHDLRRTMGSFMAIGGESLSVIGKALGHTSTAATEVYSRLTIDPVRQAVSKATDTILRIGNQAEPSQSKAAKRSAK